MMWLSAKDLQRFCAAGHFLSLTTATVFSYSKKALDVSKTYACKRLRLKAYLWEFSLTTWFLYFATIAKFSSSSMPVWSGAGVSAPSVKNYTFSLVGLAILSFLM